MSEGGDAILGGLEIRPGGRAEEDEGAGQVGAAGGERGGDDGAGRVADEDAPDGYGREEGGDVGVDVVGRVGGFGGEPEAEEVGCDAPVAAAEVGQVGPVAGGGAEAVEENYWRPLPPGDDVQPARWGFGRARRWRTVR